MPAPTIAPMPRNAAPETLMPPGCFSLSVVPVMLAETGAARR